MDDDRTVAVFIYAFVCEEVEILFASVDASDVVSARTYIVVEAGFHLAFHHPLSHHVGHCCSHDGWNLGLAGASRTK